MARNPRAYEQEHAARVSKYLISPTFRKNLQKLNLTNETSVGLLTDESEMPRSHSLRPFATDVGS